MPGWQTMVIGGLVGLMWQCAGAAGAEYYLSPQGDDAAAGRRDSPWRTLAKANATVVPGDTVILMAGDHVGPISPAQGGTAEAPITYRAETPLAARLVPEEGTLLLSLRGMSHLVIADLAFDGQGRANWFQINDSHHLTLRGCSMHQSSGVSSFFGCTQFRVLDNRFSADRPSGDMLHIRNSNQFVFEGNSTTRVGHCPLRIHNCVGGVIRANVFRNEWGRNYEKWNCGRLLIENNIVTRARDSAGSADSRAKNLYDDSIFRRNLVFGNLHTPLNSGSYIWTGVAPTSIDWRGPFVTVNSRFYHNTIVDNLGYGWELGGVNVSSNVFQNNIFYRNDYSGGNTQVVYGSTITGDNRFISNLFGGTAAGQAVVQYSNQHWTVDEANRKTSTTGGFWSIFHENLEADPAFVDGDQRDYRLQPTSPAVDAGKPLALAMGSGKGRRLPVTDGRWFFDGFGIEGEPGDLIAVGQGDHVARIERVELRYYQPALLHLDREVTWEDGQPVSLPWSGQAPDLGAFEQGDGPHPLVAVASPAEVKPDEPVQLTLETRGREIAAVSWDFGDGQRSNEREPTHRYQAEGHYGVTARVTFADGSQAVAPAFVHVPVQIDPRAPLLEVSFDDADYLTGWGWYFKFYRGHQTGSERLARPDGDGQCIRLFHDASKANRTAAQIAPGAWEIDRYPIVRFDYRIPPAVPVTVEVTPFETPGRPNNFPIAATDNRKERLGEFEGERLIDDGQWHTLTMDMRRLRAIDPELRYLRQWMFNTNWSQAVAEAAAPATLEFWFDEFAILPE